MSSEAYRRSGVDLDAAAKAVELIRELGGGATRPELVEGVGGFAGLFEIGDGRFLAAATDGVGTKLEIARRSGRLDTVGIDLVAMCADDVVCTGAEPLFFLDYLAVGSVDAERVAAIVAGSPRAADGRGARCWAARRRSTPACWPKTRSTSRGSASGSSRRSGGSGRTGCETGTC